MKISKYHFLALGGVLGDIYMHHPKGSNNRLNEPSNGRRNAKRLFGKFIFKFQTQFSETDLRETLGLKIIFHCSAFDTHATQNLSLFNKMQKF